MKSGKMLLRLELLTITGILMLALVYRNVQSTQARGRVDGIIHSEQGSSVLIDGRILEVGDTIYGVEVVYINKLTVKFEKDGWQWEQVVRQRPNPAWTEAAVEQSLETTAQPPAD